MKNLSRFHCCEFLIDKYAKNGFSRDTYIELQNATQTALQGMQTRVNSIIKGLHKTGQDSVYNVQQAIIKDLEQHAIFSVTYSNGSKQSLHSYAAMAARSARIESTNIGAIGKALQAGTDFVKMTTMPQCCKLCGAYQGKVYSISGNDKRFPALFKTVLRSGYALPHPNCRHEFIPWHEEIEAPEDVEKAIKNSKILYDKNGELVDVRYQRDIKGYAEWQAGNRQLNREMLEYEQMKAHYAGREAAMPYKTLASFRRARRADDLSASFMSWRYRERDQEQYEEWKAILGEENFPETVDKFQEIKYNKNKKAYRELEKQKNKALLKQEQKREPKNFVLAKTVQEAEQYISQKAKTVSYSGITNIKSLNQVNRTYAYLAEKYGIKQLNEISTQMVHKNALAEAHGDRLHISRKFANNPRNEDVIRSTSGWTEEVKGRLQKWSDSLIEWQKKYDESSPDYKEYYKKGLSKVKRGIVDLEEDLKYYRHNVVYDGREVESAITHEAGHIIAEQKFQQLSHPYATGGAAEKIRKVFNEAKRTGDIYKISRYANKNEKEFFAECFTIYELGEETLPSYIQEIFKEVLK